MSQQYVEIPLTNGKVALVDKPDALAIRHLSSCVLHVSSAPRTGRTYAVTHIQGVGNVRMHRLIAGNPISLEIDHINGDCLDNRRQNLRVCTRRQNNSNSRRFHGVSPYKGVTIVKRKQLADGWLATIAGHRLGFFASEEDAARAYDAAAYDRYGQFACFNFPDEWPKPFTNINWPETGSLVGAALAELQSNTRAAVSINTHKADQ